MLGRSVPVDGLPEAQAWVADGQAGDEVLHGRAGDRTGRRAARAHVLCMLSPLKAGEVCGQATDEEVGPGGRAVRGQCAQQAGQAVCLDRLHELGGLHGGGEMAACSGLQRRLGWVKGPAGPAAVFPPTRHGEARE